MAGRDRAWRRAAVGQPPDRRACQLAEADAAQAAAGRGVALELAGPPVDQHDGLVAGLGPGGGPGRRQRLAPARRRTPSRVPRPPGWNAPPTDRPRIGSAASAATAPPGCSPGCGPDDAPSRPGGTARCCSGWTASSSRLAATAPSWPGRTARAPWCAATWPGSRRPRLPPAARPGRRHPGPHRLASVGRGRTASAMGHIDHGQHLLFTRLVRFPGCFARFSARAA